MKMCDPPSPEKFRDMMLDIVNTAPDDIEITHMMMDALMCDVLRALGYEKGIDVFRGTYKWYS